MAVVDVPGSVVAVEPRACAASGIRPRLVLARPATLVEVAPADLEDEDRFVDDLGRDVVYRRWSTAAESWLLHESWTWPDPSGATVLSASVAREDYLDFTDLFESVAESVDPDLLASWPTPA